MGAASSALQGGKLTKAEVERIKRRFERQTGKSGRMSLQEFEQIPEFAGRPHIEHIFKLTDQDHDGYISAQDVVEVLQKLGQLTNEEDKIRAAFDIYDEDGDGYLSLEELKQLLQPEANEEADLQTEMAAASLLAEYGREQSGCLSLDEFQQLAANASGKALPFMA